MVLLVNGIVQAVFAAEAMSVEAGAVESSTPVLTIEQCVQRALEVNPELNAWRYELGKASDDEKIARGGLGPSLRTTYQYSDIASIYADGPTDEDYVDQQIGTLDVALVQPLFAGFANIGRYQQAKLKSQWVTNRIAAVEAQTALLVQTSFSKIQQLRENVTSLRNTVRRLTVLLDSTKAFHDVDMAPYVQVLQAGVDLADARQRLSKMENDLKTEIIRLNRLVGFRSGQPAVYRGDADSQPFEFPMTEAQCLDQALDNRPDLLAARTNQAVAEKAVEIEAGRFYPTVNLEGHYNTRDRQYEDPGLTSLGTPYDRDQQNDYWTVGINLRFSLFESGKNYYAHRKALREVERQKELVRTLEEQIHSDVRTQFASMQEAEGRISVTRQFVSAAQENFALASKRFELQLGTMQEVLDAQERLTRAETEHSGAIYDYQQALANLYFATGMRNDSLQQAAHPAFE